MNRWGFLSVLAVVVGFVSAFAIYTFGWRDDTDTASLDDERTLAHVYAVDLFREFDVDDPNLRRVGDGLWRAEAGGECFVIELDRFDLKREAGIHFC